MAQKAWVHFSAFYIFDCLERTVKIKREMGGQGWNEKEMFESEKEKKLQNQGKIQNSESAVDNDLKKKKNIIQTFQIMHVDTHLVSLQSSWD